jgi:hypothetical protein
MADDTPPQRLSQISTMWTVLAQAHTGPPAEAAAARQLLIERYGGAVKGYLRKVVGDPDAADDLAQQFALGLVRGEFRGADPQRGRFRGYVKAVLFHLVSKHWRREKRNPQPLSETQVPVAAPSDDSATFDRTWRSALLIRAWKTLQAAHLIGYAALRFKTDRGDESSDAMAAELTRIAGRPIAPAAARQHLHRARERFADYLLDAVAHSLAEPTAENLTDELTELGLLEYCRDALQRYRT